MHEMFASIFVQYLPCLLPDGIRRTKGKRFDDPLSQTQALHRKKPHSSPLIQRTMTVQP